MIRFTRRVFELQQLLHGTVVIENPRGSAIWRESSISDLVGQPGVTFAEVDLCQFGLISLKNGKPLRKGVSLLTNNVAFAEALTTRCTGDHEHRAIEGKDTAASAHYPEPFAKEVVKAFDNAKKKGKVLTNYPSHTVPGKVQHEAEVEEPRGANAIYFKGKVKPIIAATLRRLHQNLGHPPARELVRHLKIGKAPENVIRAAEQMVCRTCAKSTKAKSARPAHPAVLLDFNEAVAADIIWIDTVESASLPALNIVDAASTYQVVLPLDNTKSEEVGRAMVEGWMSWAGAPKHLIVDLDSAFKDQFLQVMNERMVMVRCAAGQAHWQNGLAERHGKTWKGIWDKLVEEQCILDNEVKEAMAATSDAKNQLRNRSGYSPRQWVFGTQMKIAGDLFDGSEDLSAVCTITADEKVGRRHQVQMAARAAFFQCQSKEALERALAHKPRVEERSYEAGELVYAYREFNGRTRWMGPCTVIGREGQNYWLARGGRCLLCAPEHIRTATHEEINEGLRLKLAMKELKELLNDEANDEYEEVLSEQEGWPGQQGERGQGSQDDTGGRATT